MKLYSAKYLETVYIIQFCSENRGCSWAFRRREGRPRYAL